MIANTKRLNKYGLFERVVRRNPLLSKRNVAARVIFAKLDLNKPQDFCNNVLWTDKTKEEMFDHNAGPHLAKTKHSISAHTPHTVVFSFYNFFLVCFCTCISSHIHTLHQSC